MTSMASRYFQGRVIETNEPCYISWDTESCCSKIQSLIELKLEAPNLSTDHWCHGAQKKSFLKEPALLGSLFLFLPQTAFFFPLCVSPILCASARTHTQSCCLAFKDFLALSSRCREQIKVRQSHYLIHIQCPWLLVS